MDEKHLELIEKTEKFARERIAPWAAGRREEFPLDLWEEAGEAGLLGVAVPREYGGRGLGYLAVTAAVEALVATGHNPGFGLSWTIHNVVTRLVFWELARDDQRARYLPGLASGRISPSVSISEPGVGAHPRHLRTRAVGRDGEFILNGEKSYLTNGPFVELFVVLAITGGKEDRKEFSAFIVPKGTPGVALTPPLALDSFRPSPHCGIRLTDCAVPAANMIGAPGGAYQALAMAFREVEDVTLAGLISGGLTRRLALLIMELRRGRVEERGARPARASPVPPGHPAAPGLPGGASPRLCRGAGENPFPDAFLPGPGPGVSGRNGLSLPTVPGGGTRRIPGAVRRYDPGRQSGRQGPDAQAGQTRRGAPSG